MDLKVDKEENKSRLSIYGNIDVPAAEVLKKSLLQLIDEGTRDMILDFQQVDSICSSGIGALILFHEKLKSLGGQVQLNHLNPNIRSLFKIIKLDTLFTIGDA